MEFNVHFIPVACQEPVGNFFAGTDISMNAAVQLVHSGVHRNFDHGTRLTYTCQSGYHYDVSVGNIPDLYCLNGIWSGDNQCIGMYI